MAPVFLQAARTDDETGFVPLFDGASLDGWLVADGPESAFYVNDGAIVVHESAGFPTWLRSAKQYENFEFRGESTRPTGWPSALSRMSDAAAKPRADGR